MRRPTPSVAAALACGVVLLAVLAAPVVRAGLPELLRTTTAAALDDGPGRRPGLRGLLGLDGAADVRETVPMVRGLAPLAAGLDGLEGLATVAGEPMAATAEHASDGELADASTVLETGKLGTYIDEVLASSDSLVTRWPVRSDNALRYWIQPGTALPGWTVTHRRMLGEAFDAWNEASLPVRFAETSDSAAADVVVVWRGQFDEPISGKTRWTHDRRGWIRTARVTIALRRYTGEPLDTDAVRAIGLHEVGHALGLDHASDAANVMAPRVRVRQLSDADRATAQLLYRLRPGSLKR
jgi:hypothetical protein